MSTGTYASRSASWSSSMRVLVLLPLPSSTRQARRPMSEAISRAWLRMMRDLGARRVVRVELGDLVEQFGAARIVEILARQRLGPAAEPGEHVAPKRSGRCGRKEGSAFDHVLLASRMPAELPAGLGGKEVAVRRSDVALAGVTHEPPRSTIWLHMNLPLYSPKSPATGRSPGRRRRGSAVHSQTSPNS